MITRKRFIGSQGVLLAGLVGLHAADGRAAPATGGSAQMARMPDESEPHRRTWMAFGASERIWGKKLLPEVRRNLALIAKTIARHEPVSMLVREAEVATARALVGPDVALVVAPLDDLWMRDTGPTFVQLGPPGTETAKAAVNFNFNGWGKKQVFTQDTKVAALVARQAGARMITTDLVLEGGCIEVDGQGTAIITESCVLNDNRNPGLSKAAFEARLMPLLGLKKIIWLPGIKGKDITDGHTDFYARFARPGVVLAGFDADPKSYDHAVTQRHLEILKTATDAHGRKLDVMVLEAPASTRKAYASDQFAAGYIGFYVCNGAVIMQQFGDPEADLLALQTVQKAFPGRAIEQIAIDGIAAGGGSIHCATQQEPLA